MEDIKNFFKYSFDFVGIEKRASFWKVMGIVFLGHLLMSVLSIFLSVFLVLECVYFLLLLVPTLSLTARRLHDTDRSAFNLFWLFFPFVGLIIIAVFTLEKTKYEPTVK